VGGGLGFKIHLPAALPGSILVWHLYPFQKSRHFRRPLVSN